MSQPAHSLPPVGFSMPMFRSFVPRPIQPWIYLFVAFTFQLSGGVYLGALNQMIGGRSLMREDLLMCLFANLAGMAIYFPLLFRMKFRFTNKTLLTMAALGALACNLLVPYVDWLPLLWLLCFVEGMCKIQGTFECMSNIQLWMTPKRDFTIFFPCLHIVILGAMQVSDLVTTWLMYHYHWSLMHWFIGGLMLADLLMLTTCVRHFRMMKKFPLFGIDWLGALMWASLLLQVSYLFTYGDYYDWWDHIVMRRLTFSIFITLVCCLWRMFTIRHPYYEPKMWTYRYLLPVLLLITLVEMMLATEHVPEEIFFGEVMGYPEEVSVGYNWWALAGVLCGCLFALWWMHIRRYNYLKLISVGLAMLACYLLGCYFLLSSDINFSVFCLPIFCRSFAYAVLSATFMTCLEEIMTFQHFFQALSIFNMLHMVVGGVLGAAIYQRAFKYFMGESIAGFGGVVDRVSLTRANLPWGEAYGQFMEQMTEAGLKQLYGWVAYFCIGLMLLFLLYDAPVRRQLKLMPYWTKVATDVKNTFWRVRNKVRE